jgi:phosphoglucomutase
MKATITVPDPQMDAALHLAEQGIKEYLDCALERGLIDSQLYKDAFQNVFPNLRHWLTDPSINELSPRLRESLLKTISTGKWMDIVNAFRQHVRFGTGGIRGMMSFDRSSIAKLEEEGLDAPILKGPNTINNIIVLRTSQGVAEFGLERGFSKIVIGYDSRICGFAFAAKAAELFLAHEYTVFFFDAPCPYPEVTFAIPCDIIKADVGILISASHNDYRYNGYKLSCGNGSQFSIEDRAVMYDKYIDKVEMKDVELRPFADAREKQLYFLGGSVPVEGFNYYGREAGLIDIHEAYLSHIMGFLLTEDLAKRQDKADPLKIGYCAFHGAGNVAVPRLLGGAGYKEVMIIHKNRLNEHAGLFPMFESRPGLEQQPDPGDPRAAAIAVGAFREEYPGCFDQIDILIGTDPDADRCGIVAKVPDEQRFLFENRDWTLLSADDLWALVIWYRLYREIERYGAVVEPERKFIALSTTTSDSIVRLAQKHNIGVVKTWVGFSNLSAGTREIWNGNHRKYAELVDGLSPNTRSDIRLRNYCDPVICECWGMENGMRSINIAAMEQSNGFSILGGPPPDNSSLGINGHVRDKDGTFAAFLVAEIAAWAKDNETTIFELIDRYIYLDAEVGLFVNGYQPDPMDGEYPGIEGDRLKKAVLRRTLSCLQLALAGDLELGGMRVHHATVYRTGKYDAIYPPSLDFEFPDEGIRFYFDESRLNHVTVRPSGTGNSLRFHTQLCDVEVNESNLVKRKYELKFKTKELFNDLRRKLGAPEGRLFLPEAS